MLGAALGGVLNDLYGWRSAFLIVGVPGLLIAIALPFLLLDPRKTANVERKDIPPQLPIKQAFAEILKSKAFILLMLASSFTAFLGYGKTTWAGIYFIRSHGLTPSEVGTTIYVLLGLAGAIGTWAGGWFADKLGKRNKALILAAPAIGMALGAPLLYAGYSHANWQCAVALLFIPTACNLLYYGPTYACVQGLVRPEARAMATSIMMFAQNLIGLGLGPTLFGMVSDALKPEYGAASVQMVLWGAAWLALIPAALFWWAGRYLQAELKTG